MAAYRGFLCGRDEERPHVLSQELHGFSPNLTDRSVTGLPLDQLRQLKVDGLWDRQTDRQTDRHR